MKVHCNYDNKDGNCCYPECWSGCPNKIMKISLFRYLIAKIRGYKL
ncbi:hypothetical protein LCGC14_1497640 [marine sediment metagenome]|uniref:Uncharacterized protein n=1 Tax=marine sediment metagenome TaxID=412755 RepID=A0A0F9M6I9_9ZZZZ